MAAKRTKHIGSKRLAAKVTRSYERKGMSAKRAKYIGGAVAGKVYREQRRKK